MTTAAPTIAPRSSSIELMLQINVGLLVVLGTALLAMGQQDPMYAAIAIVGVAASIFITDVKKWFYLNANATTTAAILACAVLVVQVIRNVDQSHLLNVANVLIYLEMILMLQQKDDRTYWSLMALSLLQVVVAVALNLGLMFGALLGVYVMAAFSAMVLFYVVRATRPFLVSPAWPSEPHRMGQLAVDGVQRSGLSDRTVQTVLQPSLVRHLLRMLAMIFATTIVVFFIIPRYGDSVWQGAARDQVTTIGFTEEVQLDNIGLLLENPEQVMRVEFNTLGGLPYHVDGEPYFRGTVLSYYQGNGTWKPLRSQTHIASLYEQDADEASLVEQRITLQPGSHSVLFHVAPCYPVSGTPSGLFVNRDSRTLSVGSEDESERRGAFRYNLGTTAFRNGWQRDLIPALTSPNRFERGEWAPDAFPRLLEVSSQVLAELGPQASTFDRAKALESHLRSSGLYRYSLDVNRSRDRRLDPIEDFVSNHRTGHCEYFAGALTQMLRAQNIPARMVVGFRGGEFNTVGNYYIVRQLHAHAWVEAYLAPDEIPLDEWDTTESRDRGAWLRLDPTPGDSDMALNASGLPIVVRMREVVDYLQVLWDDYVLGLNATRQQQMIYGPLMQSLRVLAYELFSREAWFARWIRFQQFWQQLWAGQLIGWPWLVAGCCVALLGIWMLFRSRHKWWSACKRTINRWRRRPDRPKRQIPHLDVYAQLERTLAQNGWHRPDPVTPDEFARQIHLRLAAQPATSSLAEIPARITQAYYRVRWGEQTLSEAESQCLVDDLGRLRAGLGRLQTE